MAMSPQHHDAIDGVTGARDSKIILKVPRQLPGQKPSHSLHQSGLSYDTSGRETNPEESASRSTSTLSPRTSSSPPSSTSPRPPELTTPLNTNKYYIDRHDNRFRNPYVSQANFIDENDFNELFPNFEESLAAGLEDLQEALREDEDALDHVAFIDHEDDMDDCVNSVAQEVKVRVAIDSGSVDNVTNPDTIPGDTVITPNRSGNNFVGAGGDTIIKHGHCTTMMTGTHGPVGCRWQVANVTRPLNSVSKVTGPEDGPGEHDVLFNNKTCFVVPPGVVAEIMKRIKPVAEYPREGGLYVGEMTLSSFQRQGQDA